MNIKKTSKSEAKIVAVLVGTVLALSLSSCTPGTSPSSNASSAENSTTGQTPIVTTTTKAPKVTNPLSGIADITPGASVRPVAFMIGNNDRSRPQIGIDKADMYVEAETEGGITRIMAVFSGASRVPNQIGPIRSARTPFIKIAESLDSIYCHAGGSRTAKNMLSSAEVGNIDALHGVNNSAFWRDSKLRSTKGLEYSMMTSRDKLNVRIKAFNFHTDFKKPSPFKFGDSNKGTGAGKNVQVRLSALQTISFKYDPVTGLYYKSNGTISGGSAHKTSDGITLTATNIIIIYDRKYSENERTIGFDLEGGTGLLVSEGASRQIRWSRSKGSLNFTEYNGTALTLKAGKPYICLTDKSNETKTVIS
ncbi:MAG: DUF3048 domain-containing protein [Oscillospiraceae bacterium]|nr:DUF3048 domain-containing protein [Oscillospiraceae bacterium]MDD4413846.1 DUF3048 domain-containing protein [Oscillospiraceae bacterium]